MSRKFSLGIYSLIIFSIIEEIQTEKEKNIQEMRLTLGNGSWNLRKTNSTEKAILLKSGLNLMTLTYLRV